MFGEYTRSLLVDYGYRGTNSKIDKSKDIVTVLKISLHIQEYYEM